MGLARLVRAARNFPEIKSFWMALRSVQNSKRCFGCGPDNEAGLQLEFELDGEGRLVTHFRPRDIHGGWEGVFHGGLMATLLDEAMLAYLYLKGVNAATASLNVRFRRPVAIGEDLTVLAWEDGRKARMIKMIAEARRGEEVVASGEAQCLKVPEESSSAKSAS